MDIQVNGMIIKSKEMELIFFATVKDMKEDGSKIRSMDQVPINIKMEINIMDNGVKTIVMDTEL